jgi:hypothetical protein
MNLMAPAALWGFWILLIAGVMAGELRAKGIVAFLVLWVAGYAASGLVLGGLLFLPYVAVLDIALVLVVFKGDIQLH